MLNQIPVFWGIIFPSVSAGCGGDGKFGSRVGMDLGRILNFKILKYGCADELC